MNTVVVNWLSPHEYPSLWDLRRGLYAYINVIDEGEGEILYVGKVDGTTVRRRWNRSGKPNFWDSIESERQIYVHGVIVGVISIQPGRRLSRQLLYDVESLLINRICPWGNIQCRNSRISSPGLVVRCEGEWPLQQNLFIDS